MFRVLVVLQLTVLLKECCLAEYQTLNGYGNNKYSPMIGTSGTLAGAFHFHYVPPAFQDGSASPADYGGPSARQISLALFNTSFEYGTHGGNDLLPYFGQFICHDMAASPDGDELFPIPVDRCDPYFDKACTGNVSLPFKRSAALQGDHGYRVSKNEASTWIDASTVYGPDHDTLALLREGSGGLLKVSKGPHGDLLPRNNGTGLMANNGYFLAGDFRANVNLPMVCIHTLLHLEHNHRARVLAGRHPDWGDEKLFQEARRFIIALTQKLTFRDYAAAILGEPLGPYEGYRPHADPRVDTVFMTSAFRYGHSAVSPLVFLVEDDWLPAKAGHLPVGPTIFNPAHIVAHGMDSVLRGLVMQPEAEVDISAPSDIRNHHILVDLVAFDIQRGRDRGLPAFNEVRRSLGLPAYDTWAELTPDKEVQAALERVYGDIETLDTYVGGLAERPRLLEKAVLPPTYSMLLKRYFEQLRDADRFYYENPGVLTAEELQEVEARSFADLVLEHTDIQTITPNMFAVQGLQDAATCAAEGTECETAEAGGSGSLDVLDDVKFSWEVSGGDITMTFECAGLEGGFVGVGLGGSTMRSAQDFLVALIPSDASQLADLRVVDGHYEAASVAEDGSSTVNEGSVQASVLDGKTTIAFTRALVSDDPQDFSFVLGSKVQLIFAKSTSAFPSYHGFPNKAAAGAHLLWGAAGAGGGNATAGDSLAETTSRVSLIVHGISMVIIWMVFVPTGILIVRYRKGKKHSMEAHQTFSQAGAVGVLAFAATAIAAKGGLTFGTNHAFIGFVICCTLILQITSGWLVRLILPNAKTVSQLQRYKRFHKYIGFILTSLAFANCRLGMILLGMEVGSMVDYLYQIYLAFIILLIIIKEVTIRIKQYTQADSILHGKRVPKITHRQYAKMVEEGQLLMLINGYIYNVRTFVNRHPGGQNTIIEHLGVDATNEFENIHKHSINALKQMQNELLQGVLEDDRSSVTEVDRVRCECKLSVCPTHFKRFRILTIYQIGGTKECPIVLLRVAINVNLPMTNEPLDYDSDEDDTTGRNGLSKRWGTFKARRFSYKANHSNSVSRVTPEPIEHRKLSALGPIGVDNNDSKSEDAKLSSLKRLSTLPVESVDLNEAMTRSGKLDPLRENEPMTEAQPKKTDEGETEGKSETTDNNTGPEKNSDKQPDASVATTRKSSLQQPKEVTENPANASGSDEKLGLKIPSPRRSSRKASAESPTRRSLLKSVKSYVEKPFISFLGSHHSVPKARQESLVRNHINGIQKLSAQSFQLYGHVDGESVTRHYSPVNFHFEQNKGWVDFAIKCYPKGKMGKIIKGYAPGNMVRMKGPVGRALVNSASADGSWPFLVLIAGGTGITAMVGILRFHLRLPGTKHVTLIYQVSHKNEFILRSILSKFAGDYPGKFRVIFVCKENGKGIDASHFRHTNMPSYTLQVQEPEELKRKLRFCVRGPAGFVEYIIQVITLDLNYPASLIDRVENY